MSISPNYFELSAIISDKELEFYNSLDADTKAKAAILETARKKQEGALQSLLLRLNVEHPINYIGFVRDKEGAKAVFRYDPALTPGNGTPADTGSQPGARGISADEVPAAQAASPVADRTQATAAVPEIADTESAVGIA